MDTLDFHITGSVDLEFFSYLEWCIAGKLEQGI